MMMMVKEMDIFYIPQEVQSMKEYYDNFRMRFSTEDFKTEWHRLEIGIAAGCSISVIWFILVMEMLLRSADCQEEKAQVRSPKKAFMDDVTLLTRDVDTMQSILTRLDELITWFRMKFKAKKSRSLTIQKGKQATEVHNCRGTDAHSKRTTCEKFGALVFRNSVRQESRCGNHAAG